MPYFGTVALHSVLGYTEEQGDFTRIIDMAFNQAVFAGAEISKGRKPVTFAALDRELNIIALETWSMPRFLSCLRDYEKILLAVTSGVQSPVSGDFKSQLTQ